MSEIEISQEELQNKINEENSKNKINIQKDKIQCNQNYENYEDCTYEEDEDFLEDRNYSKDEVQELIQQTAQEVAQQLLPKVSLDLSNLAKFKLDKNKFAEGIEIASVYAGIYVTYKNVGMADEDINQLILNYMNCENNKEINTQTCNNNRDVATIQDKQIKLQLEKTDI